MQRPLKQQEEGIWSEHDRTDLIKLAKDEQSMYPQEQIPNAAVTVITSQSLVQSHCIDK